MTKEFIPYQQALALKELGFDEPCFAMWTTGLTEFETSNVSPPRIFSSKFKLNDTQSCTSYINNLKYFGTAAPLYQQAFRWFREKKIHTVVQEYDINNYMFSIDDGINRDIEITGYDTYEEAELACLIKLIEIVKNGKSKSNS
jgi:hypothetical protein